MESSDDQPIGYNRKVWDRIARAGDQYYRAVTEDAMAAARQGEIKIRLTPTRPVPSNWLGDVAGKRILCLACGGGQQSPLFAAAGANVVVFDISEQQLERDRQAATRFGLEIETIQGDMANMSSLENEYFDLVVNPCSVCFCPDLKPIWQEVYRVLKAGCDFITGFVKPVNYLFDPVKMEDDRFVVCNRIPYSDLELQPEDRQGILGSERPVEFGHSLTGLIGGQISAGFNITGYFEDRWGDQDLLSDHIDVFAATKATKR